MTRAAENTNAPLVEAAVRSDAKVTRMGGRPTCCDLAMLTLSRARASIVSTEVA